MDSPNTPSPQHSPSRERERCGSTLKRIGLKYCGGCDPSYDRVEYVRAIQGTKARIYDTRKTMPGWRILEKYAVRCGGGYNHRIGLYDGILIKDNHLADVPIDQLNRRLGPDAAYSGDVVRRLADQGEVVGHTLRRNAQTSRGIRLVDQFLLHCGRAAATRVQ